MSLVKLILPYTLSTIMFSKMEQLFLSCILLKLAQPHIKHQNVANFAKFDPKFLKMQRFRNNVERFSTIQITHFILKNLVSQTNKDIMIKKKLY